jgi:hypothetical protein
MLHAAFKLVLQHLRCACTVNSSPVFLCYTYNTLLTLHYRSPDCTTTAMRFDAPQFRFEQHAPQTAAT